MITLATLHEATEQEIFTQVKNHLLSQNKRAVDTNGTACRYRINDLKCAAGCLIADSEYRPSMESYLWTNLVKIALVPDHHVELISVLQRIHDKVFDTSLWPESLRDIAQTYNLQY
jgi:hypothetical protein